MKVENKTKEAVNEAREIMESFDPNGGATVGYDNPEYVLTSEQMVKIAKALYFADSLIFDIEEHII